MISNNIKEKQFPVLFKPTDIDLIKEINSDPPQLKSQFWINRMRNQKVLVILSTKYLALCEKASYQDCIPHFYVCLGFPLKFSIIYESNLSLSNATNGIKSKKRGFRLFKEDAQPVELELVIQGEINIWIKYLSKYLNQHVNDVRQHYSGFRFLGQGSSAKVYQVKRLANNKHYAMKSFSKQETIFSKNQNKRLRLINQINVRSLNHPNIIKLKEICKSNNSVYLILEVFQGGTLRSRIDKQGGKFSPDQIRQFLVSIADTLNYMAQQKVIHRDIKPDNIMVRNEYSLSPVIIDYGLATRVHQGDQYYLCGTPGYIAPQTFGLSKGMKIGYAVDVFSFGAIFYELLTNNFLFTGKTGKQVYQDNKKMTFDLDQPFYKNFDSQAMDLLKKMLKIDPKERITPAEIQEHPYLKKKVMYKENEEKKLFIQT